MVHLSGCLGDVCWVEASASRAYTECSPWANSALRFTFTLCNRLINPLHPHFIDENAESQGSKAFYPKITWLGEDGAETETPGSLVLSRFSHPLCSSSDHEGSNPRARLLGMRAFFLPVPFFPPVHCKKYLCGIHRASGLSQPWKIQEDVTHLCFLGRVLQTTNKEWN